MGSRSITHAARRTPRARLRARRGAEYLEQAREAAEALQRQASVHRIDEQMGDIHEARGTTQPAAASYERALATARAPTRAALNAKIGNSVCNVGDPRGLPYSTRRSRHLDPATQTNELAVATASWAATTTIVPSTREPSNFCSGRGSWPSRSTTRVRSRLIYSFLAGRSSASADVRAKAIAGRGQHRDGGAQDVSRRDCVRLRISFGERTARGRWEGALAHAAANRDEGRKAGSLARVAWSGFPPRRASTERGARGRAQGGGRGAGTVRANRRRTPFDLARSDGRGHRGGHGRRRSRASACRARVDAGAGARPAGAEQHGRRTRWALRRCGAATSKAALDWYVTMRRARARHRERLCAASRHRIGGGGVSARGPARRSRPACGAGGEIAEFAEAPPIRALGRRVEAEVLGMRQEYDEAFRAFDEAIGTFAESGSGLELARARLRRAALRLARGEASDLLEARAEIALASDPSPRSARSTIVRRPMRSCAGGWSRR